MGVAAERSQKVRGRRSIIAQGFDETERRWDPKSPVGKFLSAIRAGAHIHVAATYAGIGDRTIYDWLEVGRDNAEKRSRSETVRLCVEFTRLFAEAGTAAEVELIMSWRQGAKDDWRGARDFLARRYPDRWGERQQLDLNAQVSGTVEVEPGAQARAILENDKAREAALAMIDALAEAEALSAGEIVDAEVVE